jgi:5-methyltetrahydrofolate--homocysteine methyltransferase
VHRQLDQPRRRREKFDDICPLLKRYGAAVVALTIDEDPKRRWPRPPIASCRSPSACTTLYVTRKWGLAEEDLLFDPLTFTIATGNEDDRRLGLETLEGIRADRGERFPNCGILLGLSNISFGLKPAARQVLNSVFLHELHGSAA